MLGVVVCIQNIDGPLPAVFLVATKSDMESRWVVCCEWVGGVRGKGSVCRGVMGFVSFVLAGVQV
jgi:hypothetical protein